MSTLLQSAARWLAIAGVAAIALPAVPAQAGPGTGFIGRYSYAGPAGNQTRAFIDLDVSHGKGGKLAVRFAGGHADGSGAAPDGGGNGSVGAGGTLRFDYEDSFSNKGTGTLRRTPTGDYRLSIDIRDVQDARCLVFYGEHVLKRSGPHTP